MVDDTELSRLVSDPRGNVVALTLTKGPEIEPRALIIRTPQNVTRAPNRRSLGPAAPSPGPSVPVT